MTRNRELDALRGIAAGAIVLYHVYGTLKNDVLRIGWFGVDLFFVLSGYLITSILLRNPPGWRGLASFQARRLARIWPIYYLALSLFFLIEFLRPDLYRLDAWPYFVTFTQNTPRYWGAEPPAFNAPFVHTWTLALEQQFYLLWPLAVMLAGKRLVPMALAVAAGSVLARAAGLHSWLLLGRADGFALGGVIAAMLAGPWTGRSRPIFWAAGGVAFAGLALGSLVFGPEFVGEDTGTYFRRSPAWSAAIVLGANLLSFSAVGLVAMGSGSPILWPLRLPPLVYLGRISYGLYLYHVIVQNLVARFGPLLGLRPAFLGPVTIAASIACASLSWHLLEQPILRRVRRTAVRDAKPEAATIEPVQGPAASPREANSPKSSSSSNLPSDVAEPAFDAPSRTQS